MARPRLLVTYLTQLTTLIQRQYSCPREQASAIARDICKKRYHPLTAVVVETMTEGCPIIKAVDLVDYYDKMRDKLCSPSGSFYKQQEEHLGTTINMIVERLAERKVHKKEMLKAKAAGDSVAEALHYNAQTLIKININSLPGNYGSPYSIFYSKANYNAITSCGRALIGYANAEIEAVLGGNFAWFTTGELVNHLITHIDHGIDTIRVKNCMERYDLKWATREELFQYYKTTMENYKRGFNFAQVERIISGLSDEEVQFFWYFQNLRHLFMGNTEVFRPYFDNMFDINSVPWEDHVKPEDLFKVDGALVTFCNVAFHKYVDPGDSEIQVYDLPTKRPELAKKFVCIAKYVEKKLEEVNELFAVFVNTPLNRAQVATRKFMHRNSAVISDTDSVIFTVKDWVEWYTGSVYDISDRAYQIACCMIYFITGAVAHTLYLYSTSHGARGKFAKVMAMKNEFLYPSMVLGKVKKHYAGTVAVQEGVILPKPETDIKGVQFKGSDICKEATTFANKFITRTLAKQYKEGRISGHELIREIIEFEQKVQNDILSGGTTYYEALAVKHKEDYKTPMSSSWFYYYAWQEIFAPKYGEIIIPTKAPAIPLNHPPKEYFEWLEKKDAKLYQRMKSFLTICGRWPTKIVVNTTKVPEELIPLIQTKKVVHHNVKPCHLFLENLGISCGFRNDRLLFSDVYKFTV